MNDRVEPSARALVVTDDVEVRRAVVRLLGGADYDVSAVDDATRAVQRANFGIDVLVVEWRLGHHVARTVLHSVCERGLPCGVVLLCEPPTAAAVEAAGRYRAAVLLRKPVPSRVLLRACRLATVLAHLRRESIVSCLFETASTSIPQPPPVDLGEMFHAWVEEQFARIGNLSPRVRSALGLYIRGWTPQDVASELGISPHTHRNQVQRAREAVGADTVAELFRVLGAHLSRKPAGQPDE